MTAIPSTCWETPMSVIDYDELAELFATFAEDTDCLYRPWLADVVGTGERAVDLGCGSGRWTGLLLDRYAAVHGVDTSAVEVKMAAERHPAATFEARDLRDVTAAADGRYDLVLSVNTVHHLNDHDSVLPHLRSLVAPGGRVVVVDITDPGGWATMDYQVADAFRDAEESYRERSRDYRIAASVLELHLHPAWLAHCLTDRPLTRPEFHRRYRDAFPGAEFRDLHRVITGMRWQAPTAPTWSG
jgi:trans-aconitate methyltransferase